ncbi:TraK family protein [Deltaproteobacteria bacterium OttesenSCG-928-K17]|nr:TraK family protein [Deltaproteobacteria bacterium OttesenSCG-928-K17]
MTNQPKKKRSKYDARVEYRAVQSEVELLLDQGHSLKAVFEKMSQGGCLTVCYTTFCDYVRGGGKRLRKNDRHKKMIPQRLSARSRSGSANICKKAPEGPFVFDKDIDISELV